MCLLYSMEKPFRDVLTHQAVRVFVQAGIRLGEVESLLQPASDALVLGELRPVVGCGGMPTPCKSAAR